MTNNESTFSVGFRFGAPDLDPDKISSLLGLQPSRSYRTGELRPLKHGRFAGQSFPQRIGVWLLDSPLPGKAEAEEHLVWLLDQLEPRMAEVHQVIESGAKADFYLGLITECGQGGCILTPELLRRLGRFGVELGFAV